MTELPDPAALPNRDFRQHPIWWDECPPQSPEPAALAARCDVAVVGGGYAGLSAALELARGGATVTVLEADAFGYNASGRNSGGVSFGIDLAKVARWAKWTGRGAPDLKAIANGALESVEHTARFIATNNIDCDFQPRGRLTCAPTPRHYEELGRRVDGLNKLFDAGAYLVPRSGQHAEIGSDRFHGVMVIPRSAQLSPARYLHGLLRLCREAGVALHAESPVLGIAREGTAFRVRTALGETVASNVVLATNAQAARLPASDLRRRVVPVASHIIVTEPLAPALAGRLLPKRRTGADQRRMLAYFRLTPDGTRFLYGSRASPFEVSPEQSTAVLYRRMIGSFPELAGARISHSWGCKVAFSFDAMPHMGETGGLHYIAGCNGNGVAMMGYLGSRVGRKILDGGKPNCVFDRADFPTVPLYGGAPWFLPLVAAGYRALDFMDDLRARGH